MKFLLYLIGAFFLLNTNKSISQSNKSVFHNKEEYSISFPFKPKINTQTLRSTFGQLNLQMYSAEAKDTVKDNNLMYSVIEIDYPDSQINSDKKDSASKFLNDKINELIENTGGNVIKEIENKVNGYPSRYIEIGFLGDLIVIRAKYVLRKNKLIIAQTMTKKENYPNMESDIFFNSLTIK
ncbi:MAG: hypothetical protein K2X37_07150 [Chitinophagaceae bacterium]|nr:hypothetical protein [Chitinophagaceae bacterium]